MHSFIHADTARCYEKLKEWSKQISKLFNLNYLIYIAQDIENNEDLHDIRSLYQQLYFIDVDYVKSIAQSIDDDVDDKQLKKIDELFAGRVDAIAKQLRWYEDRYKQYLD